MRAPVPAALPADSTLLKSQSGIMPSTIAYFGSMRLPNAPARRIRSTALMPARFDEAAECARQAYSFNSANAGTVEQ